MTRKTGRAFISKAGKFGRYVYRKGKKVAFDVIVDSHNLYTFEVRFRNAKNNKARKQVVQDMVDRGLISKWEAAAMFAALSVTAGTLQILD